MISTRGKYALRVMIELAQNPTNAYIPMKEVALRLGISLKYLEQILPPLTRNGLVEAVQGKGGGYRLTRKASEYSVGEILRLTEGTLSSVSCTAEGAPSCGQESRCPTLNLWRGLDQVVNEYLDSRTLADLLAVPQQ